MASQGVIMTSVVATEPLMSKMATSSMYKYQSPRHMARNFEANTRRNIMDCEHNVNLERNVFRRFDSQNNQNPYQWRSPVRPQPSQTNDHTLGWRSPVKPQPSQTNDHTLGWRSPVKPHPSQTNDHTLGWRSPVKPQPSQTNDHTLGWRSPVKPHPSQTNDHTLGWRSPVKPQPSQTNDHTLGWRSPVKPQPSQTNDHTLGRRSPVRHQPSQTNDHTLEWISPVKPQPPQTNGRTSVFDRLGPNLQNTYTWRKPGPEQSTLPERKTPSRDQLGSPQALLEDIPKGINPVEVCPKAPHPTASGSGIRSKSSIAQSYYQAPHPTASGSGDQLNSAIYQINKKADSCHDRRGRCSQVNGDSRSCKISINNTVSDRGQFNKVSPLNRPVPEPSHQAQARKDDEFEKRVFKCLSLFFEKPWSKEDVEFIRRILSYESTPAPPEPSLEGLPPGAQVIVEPIRWRSENPGYVRPILPTSQCEQTHSGGVDNIFHINKKTVQFCTDGNGDSRSCKISINNSVSDRGQFNKVSPLNRPVPEPSHQAQARKDYDFEKRVFKCLSLFFEKPWSKEDIEFIRRILSYESTPAPPEPSLEGLPPGTQVILEPIRWLSDNPRDVPSLPTSSQNTQCEQTHSGGVDNIFHINKKTVQLCKDGTRLKKRRAPFCLFEIGSASKQTKQDSRKICRKRKATEVDCLDTINMAPPVKRLI